ncbi:MAG TPA: adenylate/guanylate cyclase domain-containing protein [Thermohalobaculum sp.]|nr:adenylate/guanylate cyclase domain-containing protein [Thermohalobaculum sp.]
MSHNTLIAEIENWLMDAALGDPEIVRLFEGLCRRLHAVGVPVQRAVLSWPTLHPLFRAEQIFWWQGQGAKLERYYHSSAGSEHWLKSPFYHALTRGLPRIRRRLTGEGALLDFDVLKEFAEQGYTDYLLTAAHFSISEVADFEGGPTGLLSSWATRRESGFGDDDLEALSRIQRMLAIACRMAIQNRVTENLAHAYLGPTAGARVLAGDIKRGDGEFIPAVVWFSDLRGSTRLSDMMKPDDYLALLNCYFECTAAPVIAHGGEILNFIGDGVLGIFPIDGDEAAAARRATAAVTEALGRRAEQRKAGTPAGAAVDFGIGLDIGELMFGNIGVPERLAFSGIGRVVNTVHRIEAATKVVGTQALATAAVAAAAPGSWTPAGPHCVPDLDRAIELYTFRPAEAPAAEAAE